MLFRSLFAGAVLALGLAASAAAPVSAAAPLDSDCIWNGVPQATRDAMLLDYRKYFSAGKVRPEAGDFAKAAKACRIARSEMTRLRGVFLGRFMAFANQTLLLEQHGVDQARLDAARNRIPAEYRADAGKAAFAHMTGGAYDSPYLVIAMSSFIADPELHLSESGKDLAAPYFVGRVMSEYAASGS